MKHRVVVQNIGSWAGWLWLALGLMGCSESQRAREPDLKALAEKLNRIETVELEEQSQSEPVTIKEATEQLARNVTQPNDVRPAVELTLEQVRAAALANNLELKVELVDPSIAQQSVDIERAKFESVFLGSARYDRAELTPGGNPFSSRTYEARIEKPLATGTLITTSVPLRSDDSGVSEAAVSVSVIQSLLRGVGTRINTQSIRIASYEKGIVDAGTKLAAIYILANVDVAYWQLYAARKELDVRREQYKLA